MTQIDELNSKFSTDNTIRFEPGSGNLPHAVITSPTATAHIYLHGAHLTHFQLKSQQPLLFTSSKSFYQPDKPIRGGAPVIFPWFGKGCADERMPMHGLVRLMTWDVANITRRPDGIDVALAVRSDESTRAAFGYDFEAALTFAIGPVLRMSLAIRNTSPEPFTFEEALHTYFAVGDVRQVSVAGLRGHHYRDRNVSPDYHLDKSDTVIFASRVDRLYRDARTICTIHDPVLNREIIVAKENSATTVVWNPWQMKPGEFPDIGNDEWQRFVCVETANARDNAYTLASGQTHTMSAIISSRAL